MEEKDTAKSACPICDGVAEYRSKDTLEAECDDCGHIFDSK